MSSTIQRERVFNFDLSDLQNIKFHAANDEIILATYVKDGYLYLTMSFDRGVKFVNAERILMLKGDLNDVQALVKDRQFVVAIKESISGIDHKRAVAGWIFFEENTFKFKECTESEIEGKIINISLGFNQVAPGKYESVDYVFYQNAQGKVCMIAAGHPCLIS
jgi:hypothetical protein